MSKGLIYRIRYGVLVLLLSVSLSSLNAQSHITNRLWFERIQTEDGLSSSWVGGISQDSLGYLWFGTQDGLVRYDGYNFTTYRYHPEDSTGLDNNRSGPLLVSSDGTLWVCTASGVNRYRRATDDFEHYVYDPEAPSKLAPGQVNDITEDKDGKIWWGTQAGGLICLEPSTGKIERHLSDSTAADHLLDDQIRVLMFDREGMLWIGTGEPAQSEIYAGGLLRYHPETREVRRFLHEPGDNASLTDNRVGSILQDRLGRIWVGTGKSGLHLFDAKNESFIRFKADPNDPNAIHAPVPQAFSTWNLGALVKILHEDQKGRFWVGTVNAGLNVYDPDRQLLQHYEHEPENPFSLKNNLVWIFFEDDQERIWIGNFLAGLHKIDPAARKFQYFQHNPFDLNSLSSSDVVGLCVSPTKPDLVWAATRLHGLNRINLRTGKIQRFQHRPNVPNSLGNDGLWTVFEDRSGMVWIGTSNGLDKYDPTQQKFTHFRHEPEDPQSLSGNSVISINEDSRGRLWVGTWTDGLNRMDRSTGTFTRYRFFESDRIVKNTAYVNSHYFIHEDRKGRIWTATWRGSLYQYLPESDRFKRFEALDGIGGNCLLEDEAGNFWIGTNERGLLLFDPKSGEVLRNFSKSDGLPSNMILSILPGEKDTLWISTNKGLCQFQINTQQVISFDTNNGLPSNTFNYQGGAKTSTGYLLFGSDNGLVLFNDSIQVNTTPPKPYILELTTTDRSLKSKEQVFTLNHFRSDQSLALDFSQRDFIIDYLGLHYTNPSKNTYRYKLEPYDADWINAGTQRNARYTNLDPGEYTFLLQASNSDGYWSLDPATLRLMISPPWWRTTLAYVVYLIATMLLFYVIYRILLDRERQRAAIQLKAAEATQLRELDRVKSRFFANISHEFRTPLTLIQGPVENLLEGRIKGNVQEQYQLILRNIKRLRQLINQLLDLARVETGQEKLQYKQQDLIAFLRTTFSSFELMAENKGIELTFFSEWQSMTTSFDQDKLEKICVNLLGNALKFTPQGGNVLFSIGSSRESIIEPTEKTKPGVILKVKDTGTGIASGELPHIFDRFYQVDSTQTRKYEGSGIGLAVVKQYVELHNGKIWVESELGRGTTFLVFLPLNVDPNLSLPEAQGVINSRHTGSTHQANDTIAVADDVESPTLLVIDDNADMRRYIRDNLQNNYALLEAGNGAQGLTLAIDKIPDLIISDVMMPEIDGFELCRSLRTDHRTSHIPIILLTARTEAADRLQGFEFGADAYLTKPFNRQELNLRIEKLIEQRENLRRMFAGQTSLQPKDLDITPVDQQFLNDLISFIESEISNEQISVLDLSEALNMSRSQMHRKLKGLTGESPGDFLRRFRLQRAAQLFRESQWSVSEVAFEVGFRSHAHFSQAFRKHHGLSPTDYLKKFKNPL